MFTIDSIRSYSDYHSNIYYCYICKVMNSNVSGLDSSTGRALDYCVKGMDFDPRKYPKFFFH